MSDVIDLSHARQRRRDREPPFLTMTLYWYGSKERITARRGEYDGRGVSGDELAELVFRFGAEMRRPEREKALAESRWADPEIAQPGKRVRGKDGHVREVTGTEKVDLPYTGRTEHYDRNGERQWSRDVEFVAWRSPTGQKSRRQGAGEGVYLSPWSAWEAWARGGEVLGGPQKGRTP